MKPSAFLTLLNCSSFMVLVPSLSFTSDVPHLCSVISRHLRWSPLGVFEGAEGPGLELAQEVADPAGVVEPGLVAAGLVGGQAAGDGLAGDGAGPVQVGPVKGRRVGLASAVRLAAAHEAAGEGPG